MCRGSSPCPPPCQPPGSAQGNEAGRHSAGVTQTPGVPVWKGNSLTLLVPGPAALSLHKMPPASASAVAPGATWILAQRGGTGTDRGSLTALQASRQVESTLHLPQQLHSSWASSHQQGEHGTGSSLMRGTQQGKRAQRGQSATGSSPGQGAAELSR